jgi:hypothetical protein
MIVKKQKTNRIEIDLTGPQGNAFALMAMVKDFGSQLGWTKVRCQELVNEMMDGDYEHLIQVFDREFGHFVTLYR